MSDECQFWLFTGLDGSSMYYGMNQLRASDNPGWTTEDMTPPPNMDKEQRAWWAKNKPEIIPSRGRR